MAPRTPEKSLGERLLGAGIMARCVAWALLRPLLIALPLAIVLLPILAIGRTQTGDSLERFERYNSTTPLQRMATNALFQVGAIRLTTPSDAVDYWRDQEIWTGDIPTPEEFAALSERSRPPEFSRSEQSGSGCGADPALGAISIAERYMRTDQRRLTEIELARALQTMTGWVPNWSYGGTQVRLSTLREALHGAHQRVSEVINGIPEPTFTNAELFSTLISGGCGDVYAAALVLTMATDRPDLEIEELAVRYRGGRSRPVISGLVSYETLVAEIARQLDRNYPDNFFPDNLYAIEATFSQTPMQGFPFACLSGRYGPNPVIRMLTPGDPDLQPNNQHDPNAALRNLRQIQTQAGGQVLFAEALGARFIDRLGDQPSAGEFARLLNSYASMLTLAGLEDPQMWGGEVQTGTIPADFDDMQCDVLLVSDTEPTSRYRWTLQSIERLNQQN